ncbi:MAG: MBL fold metallo-hydrolase, partial [Clostridia bacterium]|nr:MBL fold metallo-hydrolase [Clostridia bacterium]
MNIYTFKGVVPDYYQAGYVLLQEGEALAVDCAFDPDQLKAFLNEQNARLHGFLLTHCHFDHVFCADVLPDMFGVKLYASVRTQALLDDGSWLGQVPKTYRVDVPLEDGQD